MIIPIPHTRIRLHSRNKDARANITHLPVPLGNFAPRPPGIWERRCAGDRVVGIPYPQLRGRDRGELVLDESIAFANIGRVHGSEDGAFVCVVACERGDVDESPGSVGGVGVVGYEIVVECGAVHIERRVLGAGKGCVDVLGLQILGREIAEAGKGIGAAGAAGADYEVVVGELVLVDCAERGEGLGFGCCGVEEAVVAAVVGCYVQVY